MQVISQTVVGLLRYAIPYDSSHQVITDIIVSVCGLSSHEHAHAASVPDADHMHYALQTDSWPNRTRCIQ